MASPTRKTVALLFLGGATIDTRYRAGDTVTQPSHVKQWLRAMSEMDIIADTQGVFIASGLSTVGIPEWQRVAETLTALYDEVDGFVVLHQLETLPAAATALSLMTHAIGKPVVLCGSPLPNPSTVPGVRSSSGSPDFGTKASFINAVQVAVTDVAGVIVVYGSHMYRAESLVGPMSTVRGEIIGKIDFGIRFFADHAHRHHRTWKPVAEFDTHVSVAEYVPGLDLRSVIHIPKGTRAIFLSNAEGGGGFPAAIVQLRQAVPTTISIVVFSEAAVALPGVLTVTAPSRTAALLRLMWALGQTSEAKRLKKLLS